MNRLATRSLLCLAAAAGMVLSTLAPASPVAAQTDAPPAEALTVSPPSKEFDGVPGQKITHEVTIDNQSDQQRTLSVEVQNFRAGGEQGEADVTDDPIPNSIAEWTKVKPQKAVVPPRGSQKFQVEISIPQNAPPGGQFGAVVFQPVVGEDPNANVKVISRVTSIMLLRLPGDATEKASVASFSASGPDDKADREGQIAARKFFQQGPPTFHVRVKNEGNVHFKPKITIEVRNIFGSKIATLQPEERNVLPDSIRRFDAKWNHKQLFGLYNAKATIEYGSTKQVLTSETSFWGAPLKTIAIGFTIVLALFILLWLPRKRLRKALKALAASGE